MQKKCTFGAKSTPQDSFWGAFLVLLGEFLLGEEARFFLGERDAALGHGLEVGRTGGEVGLPVFRVIVQAVLGGGAVGADIGLLAEGLPLFAEELADVVRQHVLRVAATATILLFSHVTPPFHLRKRFYSFCVLSLRRAFFQPLVQSLFSSTASAEQPAPSLATIRVS